MVSLGTVLSISAKFTVITLVQRMLLGGKKSSLSPDSCAVAVPVIMEKSRNNKLKNLFFIVQNVFLFVIESKYRNYMVKNDEFGYCKSIASQVCNTFAMVPVPTILLSFHSLYIYHEWGVLWGGLAGRSRGRRCWTLLSD